MFTLFKKTKGFTQIYGSHGYKLTTSTKTFTLKNNPTQNALIIKLMYQKNIHFPLRTKDFLNNIFRLHKNCLFLATMPTVWDDRNFCYPGHNFSWVIDSNEVITGYMSKKPDMSCIISERRLIPEVQYFMANHPNTTKIFRTHFSSLSEDIEIWENRASEDPDYPLFLQIVPLLPQVGLTLEGYKDNVAELLEQKTPYSLFSSVDEQGRYLPADNCNIAVNKAIFGQNTTISFEQWSKQWQFLTVDRCCQDAAMHIIADFAENKKEYRDKAEFLGLNKGIQYSQASLDNYRQLCIG